jgi:cytochrome b involved in lipid metabolism
MISIFGAGIAGLTAALELVEKGFKIKIYEKDSLPGGMAKSKRINGIPTEHSWRGYAPFYYNTFNLLKRIPINVEPFTQNYTINEVAKHNTENDAWTIYKGNVYNITEFIPNHPGGKIIMKAIGQDLEKVWAENNVSWHNKNKVVLKTLEKYKIGTLVENFTSKQTAYDNLVPDLHFELYNNKKTKKKINYYELKNIIYDYLVYSFGNKRSEQFYSTPFKNYFNENKSKYNYDFIMNNLLGPGFGLDKNTASSGSIFHVLNLQFQDNNIGSIYSSLSNFIKR